MSIVSKLLEAIKFHGKKSKPIEKTSYGIPTVKFDSSRVSARVTSDIRKTITLIKELDEKYYDQIYDASLRSVSAGRDIGSLCDAILQMNINGISKQRAAEISRLINNKASAVINSERQESLDIKYAAWLYSGAPCHKNRNPTNKDIKQDSAHKNANGKPFDVSKGMFLNRKWTMPGMEEGCRCSSRSLIKGRDYTGSKPSDL